MSRFSMENMIELDIHKNQILLSEKKEVINYSFTLAIKIYLTKIILAQK